MGAIFFYIFIYFIGYYASNILNMLTVRPFITNRYIAALLPVYGVALTHAYVMVSSPPPQGTDVTVEYALGVYIAMPVVVVTMGAMYFMWNSKGKDDDFNFSEDKAPTERTESVDADTMTLKETKLEDIAASTEKESSSQDDSGEMKRVDEKAVDVNKSKDA